jgi:hypothetical protein
MERGGFVNDLRLKILVVDHKNSEFLQSAINLLDKVGFEVDYCFDKDSMYKKLKSSIGPTDFLVIDLSCIQEADGYFTLTELKEKEFAKDLRIVLCTQTLVEEKLRATRQKLGIVATFNKVRCIEELLCIITNIISPTGKKLRRSRRIPTRFLVDYTAHGRTKSLRARNLSREGIFVENQPLDPIGLPVELSFQLPGQESKIVVGAKVARLTQGSDSTKQDLFPAGNGLEFTEISEADACCLKKYLDSEEARIFGPEEEGDDSYHPLKAEIDLGPFPDRDQDKMNDGLNARILPP